MKRFIEYLFESTKCKDGMQIAEGANIDPKKNDSHEILTAVLCLLPQKKVEEFKQQLEEDAANAQAILAQLYQLANTEAGKKLYGASQDDSNIKSITLNANSPVLLAKAISAALAILDKAKTSFKNVKMLKNEEEVVDEADLGKLKTNGNVKVYLTGNSWDKDISEFTGIENLKKLNVDSCGMKDFNSSDIVLTTGNKKFLGVSLKHKDTVTSGDPTLINRSFIETLNFDRSVQKTINNAITSTFNNALKNKAFLDEIFGKPNSKEVPHFIKAIVDMQLQNIIGDFDASSKNYLSLSDIVNAANIKGSNECKMFINAIKSDAQALDNAANDKNSADMKNLALYSKHKSNTTSKEEKDNMPKDAVAAGKKIYNVRANIKKQFNLLLSSIDENTKDKLYNNIRNILRKNLENAKDDDNVIWKLALSETKGIMNDKYEPESSKSGNRIKDKVRQMINKELANPKNKYKKEIINAFNKGKVADIVALQLFKIIFKADEYDGLYLLKNKGFDFGLCTGIGQFVKGRGKNARSTFNISTAEYKSIERITSVLSALRKAGEPTLIPNESAEMNPSAVTLAFKLLIGKMHIADVEIRYKGVYTSSPSFTATMTDELKKLLETTPNTRIVDNNK